MMTTKEAYKYLQENTENYEVLVKVKNGNLTNFCNYKSKLDEKLKDKCGNNNFDIYYIYEVKGADDSCILYDKKLINLIINSPECELLWKRKELMPKEEFVKLYEETFEIDNCLECEKTTWYYSLSLDVGTKEIAPHLNRNYFNSSVRYTSNEEKVMNFINKYENEIKVYLFNMEVE